MISSRGRPKSKFLLVVVHGRRDVLPENAPHPVRRLSEVTARHIRVFFAMGTFVLCVLTGSPAVAYNDPTHRQIVLDAFEYIIMKANSANPYGDGSTGKGDYELVRSVLAPSESNPAAAQSRVWAVADEIAKYATMTDRQPDVVLDFGVFGQKPSIKPWLKDRYFFTMFSHFLNVHRPGSLWDDAGYHYLWVETNQRCVNQSFEDLFGNFFVEYGRSRVVTNASLAMMNFKGQLKSGVDDQRYERHFTNPIRFVEFWPVTNVAKHWLDAFVQSGKSKDGAPYNLQFLAHVLHAVADSTVPYHATGISGCGHRAYEDAVDVLYKSQKKALFDPKLVSDYLAYASHLRNTSDVGHTIRGNSREAADRSFCTCDGQTCDCAEALKSPEQTAKTLVNLAVASTVVTIRAALREWKAAGATPSGPTKPQQPYAPSQKPKKAEHSEFPMLTFSETAFQPTSTGEKELLGSLRVLNYAVVSYARGASTPEDFEKTYGLAVNDLARRVQESLPITWAGQTGGQEYRDPTLAEIRDPQKWAAYLEGRRRFYAAANLFEAGVVRGVVMGRLLQAISNAERSVFEERLTAIGRLENSAIRALASE